MISVNVKPETIARKEAKHTTWAHLIERGLESLDKEKDYGIEVALLNAKIERLATRLDEQVKRSWELERSLQEIANKGIHSSFSTGGAVD